MAWKSEKRKPLKLTICSRNNPVKKSCAHTVSVCLSTYPFIYLIFNYLLMYLPIYLFIYQLIHSFAYLLSHSGGSLLSTGETCSYLPICQLRTKQKFENRRTSEVSHKDEVEVLVNVCGRHSQPTVWHGRTYTMSSVRLSRTVSCCVSLVLKPDHTGSPPTDLKKDTSLKPESEATRPPFWVPLAIALS